MMKRWVGASLVGAMLVFTAAVYGMLPERMPTHWNIAGEVDGYSNRFPGAFLMPGIALALWLLLPLLRRIDPRRNNYERFDETFWLVLNVIIAFMAAMQVLMVGAALGWPIDMTRAMLVMMGVMLIGLGNYLPRVRSNWWMGIRTPWTMESETVWRETHRIAGFTLVASGVIALLASVLPSEIGIAVAMAGLMAGTMIPVVYSYVLYRREGRDSEA